MRKESIITLDDRGNTLTFRLREMPATRLESWIMRAILLLAASGVDLPEGADMHKAGHYLATHGIKALGAVDYDKAKPLLDELLTCCHRVLPQGGEQAVTPGTADGYIEDVRTLFSLRMEVLKLNMDFFDVGGLSASPSEPATVNTMPTM